MLWLRVQSWLRRQAGQDLTEYGLLAAVIAIACIVAVTSMGTQIAAFWEYCVATIDAALGGV